jgi:hypothetical protein
VKLNTLLNFKLLKLWLVSKKSRLTINSSHLKQNELKCTGHPDCHAKTPEQFYLKRLVQLMGITTTLDNPHNA